MKPSRAGETASKIVGFLKLGPCFPSEVAGPGRYLRIFLCGETRVSLKTPQATGGDRTPNGFDGGHPLLGQLEAYGVPPGDPQRRGGPGLQGQAPRTCGGLSALGLRLGRFSQGRGGVEAFFLGGGGGSRGERVGVGVKGGFQRLNHSLLVKHPAILTRGGQVSRWYKGLFPECFRAIGDSLEGHGPLRSFAPTRRQALGCYGSMAPNQYVTDMAIVVVQIETGGCPCTSGPTKHQTHSPIQSERPSEIKGTN